MMSPKSVNCSVVPLTPCIFFDYVSYHVVSNIAFSAIRVYSQEFCDVGTAPPALILLLSRLCLDFQESTISYVVGAFLVSCVLSVTRGWVHCALTSQGPIPSCR